MSPSLNSGPLDPIPHQKLDDFQRISQISESLISSSSSSRKGDSIFFSRGTILCCDQVSDSDVAKGNSRF